MLVSVLVSRLGFRSEVADGVAGANADAEDEAFVDELPLLPLKRISSGMPGKSQTC